MTEKARCMGMYSKAVQRYGSKQAMYVVAVPCTFKPLANGWCANHQHCYELLEWGARLGYPRLQVSIGLWIRGGKANWEYFAESYSLRRREQMLQVLERVAMRMAVSNLK